jgi:Oxygenase domain of the 2OGFeDO superfamily
MPRTTRKLSRNNIVGTGHGQRRGTSISQAFKHSTRKSGVLTFPPEIYMGLVIPKVQNQLKSKVTEVFASQKMTNDEIKAKQGTYFDENAADVIYDEDVDVYIRDAIGEPVLIAKLRKQVIDPELVKTGWEGFWTSASPSVMRGAAAGPIQLTSNYWKKRKPVQSHGHATRYVQPDGTVSNMRVNNQVFSAVLGYFNSSTAIHKIPCRLTTFTRAHFENFKHGLPFITALDNCFKVLIPDRHSKQKAAVDTKPFCRIVDTAFSSITVNRNFRTGLHIDDGDFRGGYGNLSVIERGSYHGGFTLFPQYRIGFNIRTGDFLAMDVHQWHCNTELYETPEDKNANAALSRIHRDKIETGTLGVENPYSRLSFVCYLREKIGDCDKKETLDYFKKIGFDQKKMLLDKTVARDLKK